MHFKVVFNPVDCLLDINCLKDKNEDTFIPENPDQHVYFPIPIKLKDKLKKELMKLINSEEEQEFVKMIKDINELDNKRKEKISQIRTRINPEIIKVCKKFREDNAEEFI